MLEEELSYRIRGCVYEVYRHLGHGFLEKIYENALLHELSVQGIEASSQAPLDVYYKQKKVGAYFADILVENHVILELKADTKLAPIHEAQLPNYLRASGLRLGMLINFSAPKATIKRLVL